MTGPFARFTDYDFRHWVGVQAELGDALSMHRAFGLHARNGLNHWFGARETRNELAGYVADLDMARSHVDAAAAASPSAQFAGLQCRYALIAGCIRDVASHHLPQLAARYVRSGLWTREQALTWARLSPDPARALDTVREGLREEPGDRQSELAVLAISTGAAILDPDNRVLAVADLADDLPPHLLRDALAIIAREENEGSRLGGLRRIFPKLPDTLHREALVCAKAFTDPLTRAEAILFIAETLEDSERKVAIDAVLESFRSIPRPGPFHDSGWRGVARALPLDRMRQFLDFVKEDEETIAWSVVAECFARLAAVDPDWVLGQLNDSPQWVLNQVLDSMAVALARRGRHAEAAAELNRISSSVLDMPMNAGTIAELLLLAPVDQREASLTVFSRRSAGAQVRVLDALASASASAELLRLLRARAHEGADGLEIRASIAPVLTPAEIDQFIADALASDDARGVLSRVAPYLAAPQVHRALSAAADPILHDAYTALVVRLAVLGEHEEALRHVRRRTNLLEFERAAMLTAVAAHLPDAMMRDVKACARPSGLGRERGLARSALVPWLPANAVDEVVEDVLRLEPRYRIEVLADLVDRVTPDRLPALGDSVATAVDDFLTSARYDRYVVESGFRTLSGVLGRVPSMELEERALTLARSHRLSPVGHVLMLMQLASAGGEFSHVVRALTLAGDVAGDDQELVGIVTNGLDAAVRKDARTVADDLPAAALPAALEEAKHSDSKIGALAVRAAQLGELELLMSALDQLTWVNNTEAIEQVYRVVPEPFIDTLIARAATARPSERALALAAVVPRLADDRRRGLVDKVVRDAFSLYAGQNPTRLRILRALERELSTIPAPALAALWAEAMRSGVQWGRQEAMIDVRGFVRPLVAQFGPSVAVELDEAIRVGGRDEWP